MLDGQPKIPSNSVHHGAGSDGREIVVALPFDTPRRTIRDSERFAVRHCGNATHLIRLVEGGILDRWQLHEVAGEEDIQTCKWYHVVVNGFCPLYAGVKARKEPLTDHGDLVYNDVFDLGPALFEAKPSFP